MVLYPGLGMLLLAFFVVLRLLLAVAWPDLWRHLDITEFATPVSAFTRVREGVYLASQLGVSPYNGGPCHASPLLLALFTVIPPQFASVVFAIIDLYAAIQLAAAVSLLGPALACRPSVIVAFYLFNPFSLLSSLAMSTNSISTALVCMAVGAAAKKQGSGAMILLALASVLSLYPVYLLLALVQLVQFCYPDARKIRLAFVYLLGLAAFLGVAYLPFRSWDFVVKQFGTLLFLRDLTRPNIGLWWYFFIEQFEFFRPFFLGAFQLFLMAFPVPLALRFPKQPLFTLACMAGVLAIYKPYPETSDLGLYLTLLVANKPLFELLDYRPLEALGLLYVFVLAKVFHVLWINIGAGNANFYFAISLVYATTMVVLFADSTWAAVRIDFDGGKATDLTQI